MAMTSHQEAPLIAAEGSTPACGECKKKVVDNMEAEQNCKFKENPLVMKSTLEIETMG